ncbi:hypothetical protein SAMN05216499_10134 [Actinacidiphila paucisporea]|uniref:Uncharacterized protein n=1 Tax=Actinacidiphila paucisporea TaxID=310782 RepID=A0A1M6TG24_9ACTN|nr:hypothetical protein SAMN05216499_10134 [Actinacidiphila paucisporea]
MFLHGKPATTTSGANVAFTACQSVRVMSPRFGNPGWWAVNTADAKGSLSANATGTKPSPALKAISRPP